MSAINPPPERSTDPLNVDIGSDLVTTTSVTKNLDQEVHVTTRDKVELALRRVLPRYASTEQFIAVFGVLVAVGGALVTADFQDFASVPAAAWKTVYVMGTIASAIWLVLEAIKWIRRPKLEDVINEVLKSSDKI